MKVIKAQFFIAFVAIVFVSCGNTGEDKLKNKQGVDKNQKVKLTNVEVKIEGMTCEIGCARLIQSKLYKAEGINYASVSFEEGRGEITFDANRITDADLKTLIEGIAGGELYKVVGIEKVLEFEKTNDKVSM